MFEQGVLPGNPGSKASRALAKTEVTNLLENPLKTFDHVMKKGGLRVKGFFGKINGKDVVVFVSKEAKGKKIQQGELVTSFTPTPQQSINFGLNQ